MAQKGNKKGRKAPSPKKRSALGAIVGGTAWLILSIFLLFLFPAIFAIFMVGMTPTMVLAVIDRGADVPRVLAMGFLNFSGVMVVIRRMYDRYQFDLQGLNMLADPYNWLIMFGAAAVSVGLILVGPQVAANVIQVTNRARIMRLRHAQSQISARWDTDIEEDLHKQMPSLKESKEKIQAARAEKAATG